MNTTNTRIGFIGLGLMGSGIARRLAAVGYPTVVYDVADDARQALAGVARVAESVTDLARRSDIVMLSLPGSPEVEGVVADLLEHGVRGLTVIDLSTSYPASSIKLHGQVASAGGDFLDASLSGGPRNAVEGTLNVMAGGDKDVFDRALPILRSFAKNAFYCGGPGSGNTVKLAGNYLSILYVALYAEILPLVEKTGVDPQVVLDVVGVSGANCPIFQLFAPKIARRAYDPSFRTNLAVKDLSYAQRLFEDADMTSRMLEAGLSLYQAAADAGLGDRDASEIAEVVRMRERP